MALEIRHTFNEPPVKQLAVSMATLLAISVSTALADEPTIETKSSEAVTTTVNSDWIQATDKNQQWVSQSAMSKAASCSCDNCTSIGCDNGCGSSLFGNGDDGKCNYGPEACVSRGTLFQWSYGTSFSGGPDLDAPLVTDRPDFTEASSTVGKGVLQVEFGYAYTFNNDAGTRVEEEAFGEPLFRYGIFADWLEFRIAFFPTQQEVRGAAPNSTISGTEDLYLGFKIGLTPQEGVLPEMAIIPQMTVPTGTPAFTDDEALPGVNWVYSWVVNDFLAVAGSTQFNRKVDGTTGNAYTQWAQSVSVAYTLTDEFGAYTEWYAYFPHSADTDLPEHYFNFGFTYLLSNDVQFDVRYGRGLNAPADDYFFGTGLSVRFK